MNNEEIKKLRSKRINLKTKISLWYKTGRNPIELCKEYKRITDILKSGGKNVHYGPDYMTVSYWEGKNDINIVSPLKSSEIKSQPEGLKINSNAFKGLEESITEALCKCTEQYNNIINRIEAPKELDKYHISLVWEGETKKTKNIILEEVGRYLKEMGCSELGYEFNDSFLGKEHIYKYEFCGDNSKYQSIIQSSNYIAELVRKIESINVKEIAIFGKKISY